MRVDGLMAKPEFRPEWKPERLANWTRGVSEVGDPRFSMQRLTATFDLPIFTVPSMIKSGSLQLRNDRVVILVREASAPRRRFTAAHELAHYLLAAKQGISIRDQIVDPAVERYCDEFASHLLLPRRWLLNRIEETTNGLAGALWIAERAESSLPAVVVALNQRAGWRRRLLRWKFSGGHYGLVAINGPRSKVLASTPDADAVLEGVRATPSGCAVTLETRHGSARFEMEAMRRGQWIYGLLADDPCDLLWDQIHPEVIGDPRQRRLESGVR